MTSTVVGWVLIILGVIDVGLGNFVVGPRLKHTSRGSVITTMTVLSGILMQLSGVALLLELIRI